jgi:CheY-like chemotaxis protein/HPt (histidine-containing phosphotransfer) domain-containing protein
MEVGNSANLMYEGVSSEAMRGERHIVIVDDDDPCREVLTLIAMEAGFTVESFASGEEAVVGLNGVPKPTVVLTDMQMPGVSGNALAEQIRRMCGNGTTVLAMSGSEVAREKRTGFDGFLLKPFSADDLLAACDHTLVQAGADSADGTVILNEAVFENFARGMPGGQVFGLYKMCLEDSGRRLTAMRRAVEAGDDAAYRRAAHAIKGGCGMVGALELAKLAAEMETDGLPSEHDVTPLDHFLDASMRLERMLDSKARGMQADATAARP